MNNQLMKRKGSYRDDTNESRRNPADERTPDQPRVQDVGFWGVKIDKSPPIDDGTTIPFQRNLDPVDGLLPRGAYRKLLTASQDSNTHRKDACAISIDVNFDDSVTDATRVVANMQRMIDSGFNTFVLSSPNREQQMWAEEAILGRLQQDTPNRVIEGCNIVLPYHIPTSTAPFSRNDVRSTILDCLGRTGMAEIDTLQLTNFKETPYLPDILDCLTDLKHDGLLRSVTIRDQAAWKALRVAQTNGFDCIDGVHESGSLLRHPRTYKNAPIWASSALLGGLLTDRFSGHLFKPDAMDMMPSARYHFKEVLRPWAKRTAGGISNDQAVWKQFRGDVLEPLDEMALRYEVPMACLVLRWMLQRNPEQIESVAVCSRLMSDADHPMQRHLQLRKVFQFELEEEDLNVLEAMSHEEEIQKLTDEDLEMMMEKYDLGLNDAEMDEEYLQFLMQERKEEEEGSGPKFDLSSAMSDKKLWL